MNIYIYRHMSTRTDIQCMKAICAFSRAMRPPYTLLPCKHTNIHTYKHIYTHMVTCIHMYIHACIHIRAYVNMHAYIQTYIHAHIC
jgi:hypothetical protein